MTTQKEANSRLVSTLRGLLGRRERKAPAPAAPPRKVSVPRTSPPAAPRPKAPAPKAPVPPTPLFRVVQGPGIAEPTDAEKIRKESRGRAQGTEGAARRELALDTSKDMSRIEELLRKRNAGRSGGQ